MVSKLEKVIIRITVFYVVGLFPVTPLNEAINACYLAESPDAIVSLAESLLYTPSQGYGKNKRMKLLYQKYLGSLDDNPDQKLINLLKNI